jgi:hypothetical protein
MASVRRQILVDVPIDRVWDADRHPKSGELMRRGDASTVAATALRTSVPVEPWKTAPVTPIGLPR